MSHVVIAGLNHALFIVFARNLDPEIFIAFSTAVGLHILAWFIADGGVSYVAPRERLLAVKYACRRYARRHLGSRVCCLWPPFDTDPLLAPAREATKLRLPVEPH